MKVTMQVCVNCGCEALDKNGRPVEQAFDQRLQEKSGLVKLIECKECGENVDKYIGKKFCRNPRMLKFRILATFADNFGHICRQFYHI